MLTQLILQSKDITISNPKIILPIKRNKIRKKYTSLIKKWLISSDVLLRICQITSKIKLFMVVREAI